MILMKRESWNDDIFTQVKPLKTTDNWRNIFFVAQDWLTIILVIKLVQFYPFLYLIGLFIIGSRMRALENLVHESSHHNLFKNKFLNRWIGLIFCAFPIGSSLHAYSQSHSQHHKYLSDVEKDPDRVRYRELGIDNFPVSFQELMCHLAKVFTLTHVPKYLKGTIKVFVSTSDTSIEEKVSRWLFWIAIITLIILFNWWKNFILFWIIPFLTSFQIIRYLAEMSEHGGLYE